MLLKCKRFLLYVAGCFGSIFLCLLYSLYPRKKELGVDKFSQSLLISDVQLIQSDTGCVLSLIYRTVKLSLFCPATLSLHSFFCLSFFLLSESHSLLSHQFIFRVASDETILLWSPVSHNKVNTNTLFTNTVIVYLNINAINKLEHIHTHLTQMYRQRQ